jgi:outer membrane protein TolC
MLAVRALTQARTGAEPRRSADAHETAAIRASVAHQLAQPLSVEQAVRIALVNNPALQARYWDVGVADADLAQAARLPNPGFAFKHPGDGASTIERSFTLDLAALLTRPLTHRLEQQRAQQVGLEVATAIFQHAGATRRAWVEAVAAQQALAYARRIEDSAAAAALLTERMTGTGSASALERAQQQAYRAEATAGRLRAEQASVAAHARLALALGLDADQPDFTLPEQLPAIPATAADLPECMRASLPQRLDVQAAQLMVRDTADSLGLTRATRLVNVFELGYLRTTAAGASSPGYEVRLEVPLFDWGQARVARAEAIYMRAVNQLAASALAARSQVREGCEGYRRAYAVAALYRDQVVPLRKQVSAETLLRYNGMLIGVLDLIADAREQAGAVGSYLDAVKDFWLADANLQDSLGGPLPAAPVTKEQP